MFQRQWVNVNGSTVNGNGQRSMGQWVNVNGSMGQRSIFNCSILLSITLTDTRGEQQEVCYEDLMYVFPNLPCAAQVFH